LPLFGDSEQEWPNELRGVLYLIGLLWCFCGVAIIADVFMAAIEKITSKKVLITDKKTKKKRTISVWNPTVANLTLMALGSSAPEILLNVIGIFPTFVSGDLGPGTIVGSAAFNLLCIMAVCVIAIPGGEFRKIKDMGVFACTAVFSVFAYIWLLIILVGISPDVVEWWEGTLTFVFFWVLLVLAYMADAGMLPGTKKIEVKPVVHPASTPDEVALMQRNIQAKYGKTKALTSDDISCLIEYEYKAGTTRAQLRVEATRKMFAGKRVIPSGKAETRQERGAKLAMELLAESKAVESITYDKPKIEFCSANYTVLETAGKVRIGVEASSDLKEEAKVNWRTVAGTAKAKDDYLEASGTLTFRPGMLRQEIEVIIVNTRGYEEEQHFKVELLPIEGNVAKGSHFQLGQRKEASIQIIDTDRPGILAFAQEQIEVAAKDEKQPVPVKIIRKGGSTGVVKCKVSTENGSALADADYEKYDEVLEFKECEVEKTVTLIVKGNDKTEGVENFRVIMSQAEGGAVFDSNTDGGAESCVCTITIGTEKKKGVLTAIMGTLSVNRDIVQLGNANYKDQFKAAIYVGGSQDAHKEAKAADWAAHIVTLPWKLLFATVPPADYANGWLCFSVALLMIGFVTVLIGDMAELLGCVIGMPPAATAITLVAVGTSLPDTFASKSAAVMDDTADNSIGNVTGSNSVNVFLGLGLPWMIAGIYWNFGASCEPGDVWSMTYPEQALKYPTGIFVVKAGSLGITVVAFSICAVICLGTLVARRVFLGGELGGPKPTAYLTAGVFVLMWVSYLVVSIVLGD